MAGLGRAGPRGLDERNVELQPAGDVFHRSAKLLCELGVEIVPVDRLAGNAVEPTPESVEIDNAGNRRQARRRPRRSSRIAWDCWFALSSLRVSSSRRRAHGSRSRDPVAEPVDAKAHRFQFIQASADAPHARKNIRRRGFRRAQFGWSRWTSSSLRRELSSTAAAIAASLRLKFRVRGVQFGVESLNVFPLRGELSSTAAAIAASFALKFRFDIPQSKPGPSSLRARRQVAAEIRLCALRSS